MNLNRINFHISTAETLPKISQQYNVKQNCLQNSFKTSCGNIPLRDKNQVSIQS